MMKLKRIIVLLLLVATLMSLTACMPKSEIEIDGSGDIVIIPNGDIGSKGGIFIIENNTDKELSFGLDYFVDVYKKGDWYRIYGSGDVPAILCVLPAGEKYELEADWSSGITLAPGKYRFVKQIGKYYACEFEIK